MSRIWKLPVVIPNNVEVVLNNNTITVSWSLWKLDFSFSDKVIVKKEENNILVLSKWEESKELWWTTRSIINNMVIWVTEGYKKSLEINWVWYKFEVLWDKLVLSIWFSHKVNLSFPNWISVALDEKFKNMLHISWIDKQLVWEFANKIRSLKKPEPYKWKWIKYVWEIIRRKAWKTGKK